MGQGMKGALREVLRVLRRGKWTFLLIALVVTSLVGVYVALSKPDYSSFTILLVEEDQQLYGNVLGEGLEEAVQRNWANMSDRTLLLQQSLVVAERTVHRLRVAAAADSIPGTVTALDIPDDKQLSLTELSVRLQEDYLSSGREDVREGNGLRITATSTNPHEAAFIANAYAQEYVKRAQEVGRRRIAASRTFLENQLVARKRELGELEDDIEQYMSREGAAALDEEARQTVRQVAELEARLDGARVERERREAALASVQRELDEIRPWLARRVSSGVDEEINRTQNRIADLEARLEQIYIKNPDLRADPSGNENVLELGNQIAELKDRASKLSEEYIEEMMAVGGTDPLTTEGAASMTYVAQLKRQAAEERVAISGAEAEIRALEERLVQYEQRMEAIPEQLVELAQLRRDQRSAEELYVSLQEKLQEVRLADEAEIAMADFVRPALVPEDPTLPRSLLLAAGLLLGLALGVIGAVLRYKIDTKIYTPEDLSKQNFAPLGVIPDMRKVRANSSPQNGQSTAVAALGSPQNASSAIAEAYRRLHMSVQFSGKDRNIQTVMVTSPDPGAGKSTTVLNLAFAAARAGQRTLIIDADLRKPKMYRFLGRASGPFLKDLLEQSAIEPERLATDFDNLYAITLREPLSDADVVLSSSQMVDLIRRLRDAFDLIIFDTPPVLSVADALTLASHADATILVVGAGKTETEELNQTAIELREANAEIAGAVLNRYNPSEPSGYSSKYRYEDYGYRSATM